MRYPSINVLRAVAIAVMVCVHFVENLSGTGGFAPGGFAAPLFTFLSGVSYRLWVNAQEARGRKSAEIGKVTIRRGLFLFGMGFLFNVFVWLPEDTFNWDILTFIGAAILFLNVVRKMPASIPPFICGLVYIVSPLLRAITDYPTYWVNGYFECELTLTEVLLGFFVNGYFPIFPWIIYPMLGFSVASRMFPESRRAAGTLSRIAVVGLWLIGAYLAVAALRFFYPTLLDSLGLQGWTMFPASAEYVLGTLGLAISAFVLAHRWLDGRAANAKEGWLTRTAALFSTHSFSIYLIHHAVHLWPLWIYGLATGNEPTKYWMQAMPEPLAWLLAIAFLVGCYFLLRWMERYRLPGIESLMRWLCN